MALSIACGVIQQYLHQCMWGVNLCQWGNVRQAGWRDYCHGYCHTLAELHEKARFCTDLVRKYELDVGDGTINS